MTKFDKAVVGLAGAVPVEGSISPVAPSVLCESCCRPLAEANGTPVIGVACVALGVEPPSARVEAPGMIEPLADPSGKPLAVEGPRLVEGVAVGPAAGAPDSTDNPPFEPGTPLAVGV